MSNVKTSGAQEREPQKIVDVPAAAEFTGSLLLQTEPVEFCPNALLDKLNYSKEDRPVFILRPLNACDRHWIESDDLRMFTDGTVWANKNGIDANDNKNFFLMINKYGEFSDWEKRRNIIRKSIIGFKSDNGIGNFAKCSTDDGLSPEIFDRLPDALVIAIGNELGRIANPAKYEALGL